MKNTSNQNISENHTLYWFIMSTNFLKTSRLLLEKLIETGNKHIIISDTQIDWQMYEEKTKWSDFNTLLPTLHLLVHGVELMVKALTLLHGIKLDNTHNEVKKMLYDFPNILIENGYKEELIILLKKYWGEDKQSIVINKFLDDNPHLQNKLAQNIKYPEAYNKKNNFDSLQYQERSFIPRATEIIEDINKIIELSVKYEKEYKNNIPT